MISVKIFYAFLVLGTFLFYIMYIDVLSLMLFLFVLLMPVASWILFYISKNNFNVSLITKEMSVSKNDIIGLDIILENSSFVPISMVEITVSYKNELINKSNTFMISSSVRANNIQKLCAEIKSEYCGLINAKIIKVKIYDLLHLFSKKYNYSKGNSMNKSVNLTVLPKITDLSIEAGAHNFIDYESDYLSKTQKGDDPSEVFDIHEYEPGDKLNRVHWKLSARTDELFVKDYSLPLNDSICLVFDSRFVSNNDIEASLSSFDTCIEGVMSFSYYLCENEIPHRIITSDSVKYSYDSRIISEHEDCYAAVNEIMKAGESKIDYSVLKDFLLTECEGKQMRIIYFTSVLNQQDLSFLDDYSDFYTVTVIHAGDDSKTQINSTSNVQIIKVQAGKLAQSIDQLVI